jgi:hypothetical protein
VDRQDNNRHCQSHELKLARIEIPNAESNREKTAARTSTRTSCIVRESNQLAIYFLECMKKGDASRRWKKHGRKKSEGDDRPFPGEYHGVYRTFILRVTMTDKEPSSTPPVAPNSTNLITELNDNDVLLGRGSGPSQFVGNRGFRALVDDRRDEYNWAHKNKEKNEIAKELYDGIRALGGRFLKLIESMKHVDDVVRDGVWFEASEAIALEKCKQSLREKHGVPDGTNGGFKARTREAVLKGEISATFPGMGVGIAVNPTPNGGFAYGQPPPFPPNLTPVLPSMVAGSNVNPFLFQSALFVLQQQATALQPMVANPVLPPNFNGSAQNLMNVLPDAHAPGGCMSQGMLQYMYHAMNISAAAAAYGSYVTDNVLASRLRYLTPAQAIDSVASAPGPATSTEVGDDHPSGAVASSQSKTGDCVMASSAEPSVSEIGASAAVSEGETSDFLLFCVASGRPRFTEEQEKIEKATMTNEEKAAALSDLFGRSCSISTHVHKRAKMDLDRSSVEFLVQQMRLELERIPEEEKRALTEAQTKGRAEEFSDARLERFLRCEGMNAKVRLDVYICPFSFAPQQIGSLISDILL